MKDNKITITTTRDQRKEHRRVFTLDVPSMPAAELEAALETIAKNMKERK